MISSLGLGLIGAGVIFMWAGWKDRRVGDFFAQLRQSSTSIENDPPGGGDWQETSPAAYSLPPGVAGPVLPQPPGLR